MSDYILETLKSCFRPAPLEAHCRGRILFMAVAGSRLYRTHNENSDLDIRGVFLPSMRSLMLKEDKDSVTIKDPTDYFEHLPEDIKALGLDITLWSAQKWLHLLSQGDTNAIDLLFADTVFYSTESFDGERMAKMLVPRSLKGMRGYAVSQAIKYGLKGDKLRFLQGLSKSVDEALASYKGTTKDITVGTILSIAKVPEVYAGTEFQKYCYATTSPDGVASVQVLDKMFFMVAPVTELQKSLHNMVASFGTRAEEAMNGEGFDKKAASHTLRVLIEMFILHRTGVLNFATLAKEDPEIKKTKTGEMTQEEWRSTCEYLVKTLDRAEKESVLSENPDPNGTYRARILSELYTADMFGL